MGVVIALSLAELARYLTVVVVLARRSSGRFSRISRQPLFFSEHSCSLWQCDGSSTNQHHGDRSISIANAMMRGFQVLPSTDHSVMSTDTVPKYPPVQGAFGNG